MYLITDFIFDGVFRLYYCCFKIFLRGRLITADRKMHIILAASPNTLFESDGFHIFFDIAVFLDRIWIFARFPKASG